MPSEFHTNVSTWATEAHDHVAYVGAGKTNCKPTQHGHRRCPLHPLPVTSSQLSQHKTSMQWMPHGWASTAVRQCLMLLVAD